ncbi:hypothetical protein CTAYLR_004262 [Chrysophaeum taylorii]|uniref:Protein kinase domain-containing protein n=1 Tax=Chrysophaeum taylorii TaxID=2483200 RepID=A0AAD7UDP6_9STRA|nr:hypothetical protein CTAYLR_004262 [Chrysophaeum taylorii]
MACTDQVSYDSAWRQQRELRWASLAEYRFVRQIGKGTFATVWHAKNHEGREVAIKVVDKKRVDNPDVRKVIRNIRRLNTEVEVMRAVAHEGIVRLFDATQTDTHVFFVLEYSRRGDLFDLLKEFPTGFPASLARSLNRIIALALRHLHARSIAHRDLKPENVLVVDPAAGRVKLCDFGVSVRDQQFCTDFVGSVGFFAPEIAAAGSYDVYAADVWSFGALLLETTKGTRTFDGLWLQAYCFYTKPSVFFDAIRQAVADVSALPWGDESLARLVEGALRLDPRRRDRVDAIVTNRWLELVTESNEILRLTLDEPSRIHPRRNALPTIPSDDPSLFPTLARSQTHAYLPSQRQSDAARDYTFPAMTICHLAASSVVTRGGVQILLSIAFPNIRHLNFHDPNELLYSIIRHASRICIVHSSDARGTQVATTLRRLDYAGLILTVGDSDHVPLAFDGALSSNATQRAIKLELITAWRRKFGLTGLLHAAAP